MQSRLMGQAACVANCGSGDVAAHEERIIMAQAVCDESSMTASEVGEHIRLQCPECAAPLGAFTIGERDTALRYEIGRASCRERV